MEREVKQSELITIPEENNNNLKKSLENSESRLRVPPGYYPIRLSTKGKLDIPEILHFRNFNMAEIIDLSTVKDEEEKMFMLIKCINNMCFENVKCEKMHENELTEVMLHIYFMFNNQEIGPYQYYINDELEEPHIKENIGQINFSNNNLEILSIEDKFKEPISISSQKTKKTFKFRLPRIQNTLMAREYILEKYKSEKESFIETEYKIQYNKNKHINEQLKISDEELKAYEDYTKKKTADFLKVFESSLIIGDNKKEFTLEEAIQTFENNEIELGIWLKYNQITKDIRFGLNESVTFTCPKTQKSITRRFLFRADNFIPNMELSGNSDYDVSFGD